MLRQSLLAVLVLGSLASTTPAAAESSTIRIEPRPYYGAVVTLEQGVRVWRPLPPTRHMIINPTGSPVHVNVADVHETITHNGPVYGAPAQANAYAAPGYAAPGYFVGRAVPRRHRPHPRGH